MTTNYTNQQLQLALAKMLPKEICPFEDSKKHFIWLTRCEHLVLDTEWLHVCWLVEKTLKESDDPRDISDVAQYYAELDLQTSNLVSASWQQRAIALAKVKGIEIV